MLNLKRIVRWRKRPERGAFESCVGVPNTPLILRRAPGGESVARSSEAITLRTEIPALLACADIAGVPCAGRAGRCLSRERLWGEAFHSFAPHSRRNAGAEKSCATDGLQGSQSRACENNVGEALLALHAVDSTRFPDLPPERLGADQIQESTKPSIGHPLDLPRPVISTLAFAWLKANEPHLNHGAGAWRPFDSGT